MLSELHRTLACSAVAGGALLYGVVLAFQPLGVAAQAGRAAADGGGSASEAGPVVIAIADLAGPAEARR